MLHPVSGLLFLNRRETPEPGAAAALFLFQEDFALRYEKTDPLDFPGDRLLPFFRGDLFGDPRAKSCAFIGNRTL